MSPQQKYPPKNLLSSTNKSPCTHSVQVCLDQDYVTEIAKIGIMYCLTVNQYH